MFFFPLLFTHYTWDEHIVCLSQTILIFVKRFCYIGCYKLVLHYLEPFWVFLDHFGWMDDPELEDNSTNIYMYPHKMFR